VKTGHSLVRLMVCNRLCDRRTGLIRLANRTGLVSFFGFDEHDLGSDVDFEFLVLERTHVEGKDILRGLRAQDANHALNRVPDDCGKHLYVSRGDTFSRQTKVAPPLRFPREPARCR
jgi:hypothetical protein